MGYRSQVVLVISNIHTLPTINTEGEPSEILDWCTKTILNDWTCYEWKSVKWYESYPDVDAIMKFLDTIPTDSYYLAILGEELGDFECKGDAVDYNDCPFGVYTKQSLVIEL